jgi:hydroxymethylpyrimidine/phosphomethylpyrimidine kinase
MIPVALTIAGSDSGGGSGIQADLKTFSALGVYGTTAVTAVTAQDTLGVFDVAVVGSASVAAQFDAVVLDMPPDAIKIGMLGSRANVEVVADRLRKHAQEYVVLDPVLASTSGTRLLDPDAVDLLRAAILPRVVLVTPNLAEAGTLVGSDVRSVAQMETAARTLCAMGARHALVKGGHLRGDTVVDVFFDGDSIRHLTRRRIGKRPRGTGCVLSAAVASFLAKGLDVGDAVVRAAEFTAAAIEAGLAIGKGTVSNPLSPARPCGAPAGTGPRSEAPREPTVPEDFRPEPG